MIKWLEKWALKNLLKRVVNQIPDAENLLEKHYDEIEIKIATAIKKILIETARKVTNKISNN
jgi:hypothetical protein